LVPLPARVKLDFAKLSQIEKKLYKIDSPPSLLEALR